MPQGAAQQCLACPPDKLSTRPGYVPKRMDKLMELFAIPTTNPDQYRVCHTCMVRFRRCSGLGEKAHSKCAVTLHHKCLQYLRRLMKRLPRGSYPLHPVFRQAMQQEDGGSRKPPSSSTPRGGDTHSRDPAMTPTPTSDAAVQTPEPQLQYLPPGTTPHVEAGDESEDGSVEEVLADRRTARPGRRRDSESREERTIREEHEKNSATVAAIMHSDSETDADVDVDVDVDADVDVDVDLEGTVHPHICAPWRRRSRSPAPISSSMILTRTRK